MLLYFIVYGSFIRQIRTVYLPYIFECTRTDPPTAQLMCMLFKTHHLQWPHTVWQLRCISAMCKWLLDFHGAQKICVQCFCVSCNML